MNTSGEITQLDEVDRAILQLSQWDARDATAVEIAERVDVLVNTHIHLPPNSGRIHRTKVPCPAEYNLYTDYTTASTAVPEYVIRGLKAVVPLPGRGVPLYPSRVNPGGVLGVDPTEVYISDSRRGGSTYHTSLECPNLPTVYNTLTPEDPAFEDAISRDECQWCRYDTLADLDDEDGDG